MNTPLVILHLGLGSFHRAHQAVYLHRLHEQGDRSWTLVGGNIRNDMAPTMQALAAQGGQYTLETVSPAGERRYERIASISRVLPWSPDHESVVEVGADPNTRIISFTVTEAGYYLAPDNTLDTAYPDLVADLEGPTGAGPSQGGRAPSAGSERSERGGGHSCTTIYGAIEKILSARMAHNAGPVTLLNCDNLRSNGARFRAGMLDFLSRREQGELRAWFEANTSCPNDMVDRITPRPTPDVAQRVKAATGRDDQAAVMAESFIQWVIEDRFVAGRPAWENVGVELVDSVHAYEEAKIRVLNATHSCVAWAGTLRGYGFIHEDMADPQIRQLGHDYVTQDVIPSLDTPAHPCPIDLAAYRDVVLDRFGNPNIRDNNQRVAMDGFSKLPGMIVPTLRDCLEDGRPMDATAMLPALFFEFLSRWHRGTLGVPYADGVMDPAVAHGFFVTKDPLGAFLKDPMLWGPLAGNPTIDAAVRKAHPRVQQMFLKG
jgi:D-arabinitol 4-dehydrogenase